MIYQKLKNIKQILIAISRGILGIIAELGYAFAIMLAAFLLCVLITSF